MPQIQVVAAMNSRGEVVGQTAVDAGDKNAAARDLITRFGRQALDGAVITADAKHTSTAFITEVDNAGAFWLLPVKGNRRHPRIAPPATGGPRPEEFPINKPDRSTLHTP